MRSTPTVAWAMALVVVARSLTGLKNFAEVGEVDGEFADGHGVGEDKDGAAPEHDGSADGDGDVDDGREKRLDAAGLERGADGGLADVVEEIFFGLLLAEGFDDLHGFEALLGDGDDLALLFADLVGGRS